MAEDVKMVKQVLGLNTSRKVIDTTFRQFVLAPEPVEEETTVEEFFQMYETLFFEIPITGELNSHEYLVKRSSEYIGGEIISDNERALLEEINSLRQQLLEANQSLTSLTKLKING